MYQIYRNSKPYGKKSESETYLYSKLATLRCIHLRDKWEIKEVKK